MANSLTSLDRGRPSTLARNRQAGGMLAAARQGIAPSFAVVTYKGRNFRLKYRTEEKMVRDEKGRPSTGIDVVIVGISPNISRQYFPRAYTEGDTDGPDCFSTSGITPDVGVPHKQSAVCSTCQWSQWGSKITDAGKRAKACQETRRIAVVPLNDIQNEIMGGPMLLRIPPMSLNNLSNYSDFLASKGASFETVATRIGFDENVAYPRLSFEVIDWLDDGQQLLATGEHGDSGMCAHPLLERMLFDSNTPAPATVVEQRPTPSMERIKEMTGSYTGRLSDPRPEPEPVKEPEDDDFAEDEEEAPPPKAARPRQHYADDEMPGEVVVQSPRTLDTAKPGTATRGRPRKTEGNGPIKPTALPVSAPQASLEADIESALDNLLGE